MKYGLRHIGLTIGILSVIVSFLFFGRQHATYDKLLTVGLVLSLGCYLAILVGKDTKRAKLIWTAIIIGAVLVQQLTQPIFIKGSYRIYVMQNKNELQAINEMLLQKPGNISILNDNVSDTLHLLSDEEKVKLRDLRKKVNSYMIVKSGDHVYFGLWGFLDVRLGITYWPQKTKPDSRYRHLTGNWYH